MANTRQSPQERRHDDTARVIRPPGLCAEGFIELFSAISATLIDMPAQRIDREMPQVLREVVETFHLDRSTVWEIAEHRHGFRVTHSFAVDGIDDLPRGDVDAWFPYLADKALAGEPMRCDSVHDLPAEAAKDRLMLERVGQQSLLLFPFRVGGSYVGAISFGTVHRQCQWTDELVDKLHAKAVELKGLYPE